MELNEINKCVSIFLVITSFIKTEHLVSMVVFARTFEAQLSLKRLTICTIQILKFFGLTLDQKDSPRGIPCIVIGTIYHPPSGDDNSMIDYLSLTLTSIEGYYPGCGIFLTGDFNRINANRLPARFRMKQLVRVPTRGDQILDLILTNLPHLYDKNSVEMCPRFGLSYHNVIVMSWSGNTL